MIHHDGSSVSNRAYQFIRTGVLSGRFAPGTRLVTRQLADELGASLNPIREALGRLAAEGLVEHVPGAGASVRHISREELLELYEFRQALEPFAAGKAARTITEPELAILREVCGQQRNMALELRASGGVLGEEQLDRWLALEERFHETLVLAARNRHFDQAIGRSRVLAQLFGGHRSLGVRVDLRVAARTWRSHERLVRALECGDARAAADWMLDSLVKGAKSALTSVGQRDEL